MAKDTGWSVQDFLVVCFFPGLTTARVENWILLGLRYGETPCAYLAASAAAAAGLRKQLHWHDWGWRRRRKKRRRTKKDLMDLLAMTAALFVLVITTLCGMYCCDVNSLMPGVVSSGTGPATPR